MVDERWDCIDAMGTAKTAGPVTLGGGCGEVPRGLCGGFNFQFAMRFFVEIYELVNIVQWLDISTWVALSVWGGSKQCFWLGGYFSKFLPHM